LYYTKTSWRYIHWTFLSCNSFENEIECEYMLIDDYIYVDVYMLLLVNIYVFWCIYVVVGDDICNVHICCWYSSFMLLMMNMLVWTCEFAWSTFLLWSSPSSHTLLLLSFISNCCCWILRYFLCGLLWRVYKRQGRRPRRWKKFGITLSRVV